jgi:DNA polymerase-3 subunit epsilon
MKILYLDIETTGLDKDIHSIIQISGIIEINGEMKEHFDLHCRPEGEIDDQALEITQKTLEELETYPDPVEAYNELIRIFGTYINKFNKEDKFIMVGQNVSFDLDFLNTFFLKHDDPYLGSYLNFRKKIDLLYLSQYCGYRGFIDVPNYKLTTLAEYFKVPLDGHNALNDINCTRKLLKLLDEKIKFETEKEETKEPVKEETEKEEKVIKRKPVQSSNLKSVGYLEGVLEVEFVNGGIYQYDKVSAELYDELITAKSIGSLFHEKFVKTKYAYRKIS